MKILYALRLFCAMLIFLPAEPMAQETVLPADTAAPVKSIELSEISRKSAELTLMANDILSDIISEEEIRVLERQNDSLVDLSDSLLLVSDVNVETLSTRNLNGKIIYWQLNLKTVSSQESKLSTIFKDLESNRSRLEKELTLWRQTDKAVAGTEMATAIHQRYRSVERIIDSALKVIDQKSTQVLLLMDQISSEVLKIESFISLIKNEINSKQENILQADEPTLFNLDFGDRQKWVLSESMWQYYAGNLHYLKGYVNTHLLIIFFHILMILLLIYIFRLIGKSKIQGGQEEGGSYKKRLKVIASRPVSAALIVGIFANTIIYPYRPLLFMDISRFILVFPIVIVLVGILPKRFHAYAYIFGLAVVLQIIYLNLPIDNIIARLILLMISLLEIIPLGHFLLRFRARMAHRHASSRFIVFLVYILFFVSVAGLIANLLGRVMLSLLLVEGVLGLVLISIIVILSAIVINGLLVILIDSHHSDNLNIIRKNRTESKFRLTRIVNVAATFTLIYIMLEVLNLQTMVIDSVTDFFKEDRNIGSVSYTWGQVVLFFFVIWLSTVIANLLRNLLEDDVLKRVKLEKGLPHTIALLVKYTLVTVGVFLAVSAVGLPLDSLTVILGAFGVGIGFGLQNIFNNLVSGLILLFERPIKINDTIEVGTLMGNVRSIGIRSSNVRTFDGAEIIVPNGNFISNEVVNWTLSDQKRRIEVIVGVSYNSDPHQVHDVLLNVLKNHKDIINDPEPTVYFNDLGESSLDFRLLFWTFSFDQWIRIRSEIIFNVFDELKAAGIEIPFPQRDLHVRSIDNTVEFKTATLTKPTTSPKKKTEK